ncbi:hypothetical protein KP509_09G052100 [Ceratopteris richardii]|uniref:SPX domain-containing protein n=1 Tax=Ceratopteris richardii TaxID=49495 RepID=A0A8T2UAF4_CERRI|nr:hypothetical protein KP509_09G052100 [Ceratopteris richardii]
MKFGKLIQALIEDALPTWKDKYLAYKRLKKRLNALLAESVRAAEERHGSIYADEGADFYGSQRSLSGKRTRQMYGQDRRVKKRNLVNDEEFRRLLEEEFKRLLEVELEKMNDFVVEKEEEFVMRFQLFNEEIEKWKEAIKANDWTQLNLINLQKDVVVFHGEMVLLKNYSSLNYRGLVKIVKKHDRLTGAWLQLSFMPIVRRQPFYSVEIVSRLVKECENNLLSLFPSYSGESTGQRSFETDTQESAFEGDSVFSQDVISQIHRNTLAALQTIKHMNRGSSTYNFLSLPSFEDNEDRASVVDEE